MDGKTIVGYSHSMRTVSSVCPLHLLAMLVLLLAGVTHGAQARDAYGASVGVSALTQQIGKDRAQTIPLLRAALSSKQSMDTVDRLWVMSQLAKALGKSLKHEEALSIIRQGQKEGASIPVQLIHFATLAILHFNNRGMNQQGLPNIPKSRLYFLA